METMIVLVTSHGYEDLLLDYVCGSIRLGLLGAVLFLILRTRSLQFPEPILTLLPKAGPLPSSAWCTMCILLKAISHFFHLSRFMVIFQFGNLSPIPGREAL